MKKVLSDHKKIGKKFVPPLLATGVMQEVSWTQMMVPDLIWIALVHDRFGKQKGTEIVRIFSENAKSIFNNKLWNYCTISSYEISSQDELYKFHDSLVKNGILFILQDTLQNFIEMYPKCPLKFIFGDRNIQTVVDVKFIIEYKGILTKLLDKISVESTFVIGNVIYSMLVNDRLKIPINSVMARLPELKEYPNTEISKMIASSNRAMINLLFGDTIYNQKNNWIKYFWNRNIEIEGCKI
jgi:hypothetical protein